jgi:hypothetical protein
VVNYFAGPEPAVSLVVGAFLLVAGLLGTLTNLFALWQSSQAVAKLADQLRALLLQRAKLEKQLAEQQQAQAQAPKERGH